MRSHTSSSSSSSRSSVQVLIPSVLSTCSSTAVPVADLLEDPSDELSCSTKLVTQSERKRYEKFVDVDVDVEDVKGSSSSESESDSSVHEDIVERNAMNDSILGDPETDQLLVPPCPGSVTGSSDPGEDEDDSDSSFESDEEEDTADHNSDEGELLMDTDQDMTMFVGHSDGSKPLLHDNDDEENELSESPGLLNGSLPRRHDVKEIARRRSDTKSSGEGELDAEVERNLLSQVVKDLDTREKDMFGSQPFNDKETTDVLGLHPMPPTCNDKSRNMKSARESDLFGQEPFSIQDNFETAASSITSNNPIRIQVLSNPPPKPVVPTDNLVSLASGLSLKTTNPSIPVLIIPNSTSNTDAILCTPVKNDLISPQKNASFLTSTPRGQQIPLKDKDSKKKSKEKESKLKLIHVPSKLTKGKAIKLDEDDDDADGLIADQDEDQDTSGKLKLKESSSSSKKFSLVNKSSKDKEKKKEKKKDDKKETKEEKRARKEEKMKAADKKKEEKLKEKRDKSKEKGKEKKSKNSEPLLLSSPTGTAGVIASISSRSSSKPDIRSVGGFANMSFEDAAEETPVKS